MVSQESRAAQAFRDWLQQYGGHINPKALYTQGSQGASGLGIIASQDISADEEIVSCPFELVVSPSSAKERVGALLGTHDLPWNPRQWISTYLSLHKCIPATEDAGERLIHRPYLEILPDAQHLSTPLFFAEEELECFKGSNIYGVTKDRLAEWRAEWEACRDVVSQANATWGLRYEWETYLTSATYISSRSFPSQLLSTTPSLPNLEDNDTVTEAVLLPGIDCLNHARGQPVSWISHTSNAGRVSKICLVAHKPTPAGQEVFNNYGPKPNSEFVLSYGFTIPNNPDDSIIMKVGGIQGKKWTIGRDARGVEGLWKEILEAVAADDTEDPSTDFEAVLDASAALSDMVQSYKARLPAADGPTGVRPHVASMLHDYIEGQSAILDDLLAFADDKEKDGVVLAKEAGVDIVMEE